MQRFNAGQPEIKVAAYTGSYDETNLKTRSAATASRPTAVIMSANFVRE